MPLAPAAVLLLTSSSSHPWSLFVNANDLIGPTGSGNVLIESVVIDLAAPGQVSSMTFETTDIAMAQSIVPGMYVRLQDNVNDRPRFTGYVSRPARKRLGMGNSWTVECVGIEIVLDWAVLTQDVTGLFLQMGAAVQALCAAASWPAGFVPRAGVDTVNLGGSQDLPVSLLKGGLSLGNMTVPQSFTKGTTLRSALNTVLTQQFASTTTASAYGSVKGVAVTPRLTVDWWNGIRAWVTFRDGVTSYAAQMPTDFAQVTISDTYAGPLRATNLSHQSDGTQLVRTLVINATAVFGGTTAGVLWVNDGSGYAGPIRYITDPESGVDNAGDKAMSFYFPTLADGSTYGDFTLEDWTPPAGVFTHCQLTITDTQAGLSSAIYQLTNATVTFKASGEQWDIHYGRTLAPSYVDAA